MTARAIKRLIRSQPDQNAVAKGKYLALHVMVPEEAIWKARTAAVASRLPLKTFMARLMLAAKPMPPDDTQEQASLPPTDPYLQSIEAEE